MTFKNLNGLKKPSYYLEALNLQDLADQALKDLEDAIERGEIVVSDCAYNALHDQLARAAAYARQMYNRWQAEQRAEREGVPVTLAANVKELVEQ